MHRYRIVLLLLVSSFVVEGAVPPTGWTGVVTIALLGATLISAFAAADMNRRLVMATVGLVSVCLLGSVIDLVVAGSVSGTIERLISGILVALAPPALVVGGIRSVRRHGAITVEAVSVAVCIYLLIGLLFAFVYGALDKLGAGPFFADGAPATNSNCLYFSFVTQTTVGYGDLTARTDVGHTLAVSEALFGQLYLVTVVALIVGNLRRAS